MPRPEAEGRVGQEELAGVERNGEEAAGGAAAVAVEEDTMAESEADEAGGVDAVVGADTDSTARMQVVGRHDSLTVSPRVPTLAYLILTPHRK